MKKISMVQAVSYLLIGACFLISSCLSSDVPETEIANNISNFNQLVGVYSCKSNAAFGTSGHQGYCGPENKSFLVKIGKNGNFEKLNSAGCEKIVIDSLFFDSVNNHFSSTKKEYFASIKFNTTSSKLFMAEARITFPPCTQQCELVKVDSNYSTCLLTR